MSNIATVPAFVSFFPFAANSLPPPAPVPAEGFTFVAADAVAEFRERLRLMASEKRTSLDCSAFVTNLVSVPDELCALTTLTSLRLMSHRVTSIPANFSALSNLESVMLDMNQIADVSDAFGALGKLHTLSLPYNHITNIDRMYAPLSLITSDRTHFIRTYHR